MLAEILDAAIADDLWLDLVPLVDALPPEALTLVAEAVADLSAERLAGLVSEATAAPQTMDTLLRIVTQMEPGRSPAGGGGHRQRRRALAEALLVGLGDVEQLADLVPLVPDDLMEAIERSAHRLGLDDELTRIRSLAEEPRRPLTS